MMRSWVVVTVFLCACAADAPELAAHTDELRGGLGSQIPTDPCWWDPSLCEPPPPPSCGSPGVPLRTYEGWDGSPLFAANASPYTAVVVGEPPAGSARKLFYGVEVVVLPPGSTGTLGGTTQAVIRWVMSVPANAAWSALATIGTQTEVPIVPDKVGEIIKVRRLLVAGTQLKIPLPEPDPPDPIGNPPFDKTVAEIEQMVLEMYAAVLEPGTTCVMP
jgi:hypothetical protein